MFARLTDAFGLRAISVYVQLIPLLMVTLCGLPGTIEVAYENRR